MKWPKLDKPPVTVALFQIKYSSQKNCLDLFRAVDAELRKVFPKMVPNIAAHIDISAKSIPLGKSTITGKTDARIDCYTYLSDDQKQKLRLTEDTITYLEEGEYHGWERYSDNIRKCLDIISTALEGVLVTRTSIRFINNFELKDFDNPEKYVKTMIVSSEDNVLPYPVTDYGFKMTMNINDNVYAIVNHKYDNPANKYLYIFDIDVLDRRNLVFDINMILSSVEELRNIKNEIFFKNLTQDTLDLCR